MFFDPVNLFIVFKPKTGGKDRSFSATNAVHVYKIAEIAIVFLVIHTCSITFAVPKTKGS